MSERKIIIAALAISLFGAAAAAGDGDDSCVVPASLISSRPDPAGTATEVAVGVYVIDLMEIEDAEQTFTADFSFLLRWRDPRLAAAARGASLAPCRLKLGDVWNPRMIIVNQRDLDEYLPDAVLIDEAGWVEYRQRFLGDLQANFDVRDFPFDRQTLPITIASMGYSSEEVKLAVEKRTGHRRLSVAGWSVGLGEPRIGSEYLPELNRELPRLDFVLEARRHWGFYIWKMVVPLSFIVFMAWTVFWIDPKLLPPQVSIATATVFTLIAFQFSLGHFLPRVSYLTQADKFLLGSTLLVFLALGEAILTCRWADRDEGKLSLRIDRWSRWIYPVLFVLLVFFTLLRWMIWS